ncbi:MAG: protein translocase subunit SecF, partial [Candidatus Moranbacteria bacterium]|nr:protein translocase subunit SecF [Candidatus Moranbacteria bacterium]
NKSLNETLVRSINTSLTVIITLLAIYLFGGVSIKYFSLALLVGVTFGTYSSIFVASALLVTSYELTMKYKK